MQIKQVKCPNCNKILEVRNSKNESVKHIKCKVCNTPLLVKFQPQQEPQEAHTVLPSPQPNPTSDGATILGGPAAGATQLVSSQQTSSQSLKLTFNGVDYPLAEGKNIIGRQGTTSKATVQIATSDRYMSRQHCCIQMTTLPNGIKKAVLSNYQNKNATLVDGIPIQNGDQIRLQDGCQITMGRTIVGFKMS